MSLLGTAREAFENYQYSNLVNEYGEATALKLMEKQFDRAGITRDNFNIYREVKEKIQNGALNVRLARKEAEEKAEKVLINFLEEA